MGRLCQSVALAGTVVTIGCGPIGAAPRIDPVGDQVAFVGVPFVLELAASDPDADRLSFSCRGNVPRMQSCPIDSYGDGSRAVFRWQPMAKDEGNWTFDFMVTDGTYRAIESVAISVRSSAGNKGSPKFEKPIGSGTVIKVDELKCQERPSDPGFVLDIEVNDPDSTEVTISELPPRIQGGKFSQTQPFSAQWSWCPSAEQVAAEDKTYVLHLSADDDNQLSAPTPNDFVLVLQRKARPDCPGEPPDISHTPMDATTSSAVSIQVRVTDSEGLKQAPRLYYSTTPPASPPSDMTLVDMTLASGDMEDGVWRAEVPNPVAAQPAGASAKIYYVITATDNDDAQGGDCDHLTQAPSGTGTYKLTVTRPDGSVTGSCSSDPHENDDNAAQARSVNLPHESTGEYLCSKEEDWYHVVLSAGVTLRVALEFTQVEASQDLDLHLYRGTTNLTPCFEAVPSDDCTGNGQSADTNEYLTWPIETDGDYYVVVRGWNDAQNSYSICIGTTADDCPDPG